MRPASTLSPHHPPPPSQHLFHPRLRGCREVLLTKCDSSCGGVSFTVTLKAPLTSYPVNTCNCSICQINAYAFVYPKRSAIIFAPGISPPLTFIAVLLPCPLRISPSLHTTHLPSSPLIQSTFQTPPRSGSIKKPNTHPLFRRPKKHVILPLQRPHQTP